MPRRRQDDNDSLELLLDTICNTFGGIMFLALLVCLLTRGDVREALDPEDLAGMRLQVMESQDQLARQQRQHALESGTLRQRMEEMEVRDANMRELLPRLLDLLSAEAQEKTLRDAAVRSADVSRQRLRTLEAALAQQQRSRADAETRLREAQTEAERSERENRQALRMPVSRLTSKEQFPVLVSRGRLHQVFLYDASGQRIRLNDKEVRRRYDDSAGPGDLSGGTHITDALSARVELGRRLEHVSARGTYVIFAVWPDSHDAYRFLRDAALELGFSYDVVLMGHHEAVQFSTRTNNRTQ